MIKEIIKYLNGVREKFQPHIKNTNLIYTFVAPLDNNLFDRFFKLVRKVPEGSIYEVLINDSIVIKLLVENFESNVDLEIYTATNDSITSTFAKGLLKNYIIRNKLDFDY
jgi:hypothetical protein